MYKNILVPVDLAHKEVAVRILFLAARLLGEGGAVTALHVVPDVPTYAETYLPDGLVDTRIDELRADMATLTESAKIPGAQIQIVRGAAHLKILELVDSMAPDLVIIGSHRPGLSDYFLGSTAARVVRHAPCSVLVDR